MTGASLPTGIGYNIALQLALKGAKTYVNSRSLSRAEKAIATMLSSHPGLKDHHLLFPLPIELGDLKHVRSVARDFVRNESRLDIIVNNAVQAPKPNDLNEYGISSAFTVNHLAPFILTNELLPLLKRTAATAPGVRIVNISSKAHYILKQPIKFDSIAAFNQELDSDFAKYALNKLATILFTKELQRHFTASNTDAVALAIEPGSVRTDGALNFLNARNAAIPDNLMTPAHGALTALFAATDPVIWTQKIKYAGAFLVPFGVLAEPSANAMDEAMAKELWETTEQVVKDILG